MPSAGHPRARCLHRAWLGLVAALLTYSAAGQRAAMRPGEAGLRFWNSFWTADIRTTRHLGGARGCWGQGVPSQSSVTPWPCCVYDVSAALQPVVGRPLARPPAVGSRVCLSGLSGTRGIRVRRLVDGWVLLFGPVLVVSQDLLDFVGCVHQLRGFLRVDEEAASAA